MRIYVLEYFSSGLYELEHPQAEKTAELLHDGWCMLRAIVADLAAAGNQVVTSLGMSATPDWRCEVEVQTWDVGRPLQQQLCERFRQADAALIIAPENDAILLKLVELAEESHVRLLSPSSKFVELASDKLTLGRLWRSRGVPTPETIEAKELALHTTGPDAPWTRFLVKPRFGAGSDGIIIQPSKLQLVDAARLVAQPIVDGVHASISVFGSLNGYVFLPACRQVVDRESSFRYKGGSGPMSEMEQQRAEQIARMAIHVMPTLTGFASFDIVLGDSQAEDYVIECNPRMTCSYEGLRRIVPDLAQTIVNHALGRDSGSSNLASYGDMEEIHWELEATQL